MAEKISIATTLTMLENSENQLKLKFDFVSKQIVDVTDGKWVRIGDFNKMHSGRNTGKVLISPLALATIRMRIEELDDFSTTDKVIRDAMVIFYENEMKKHVWPESSLPWWLIAPGGETA